MHVPLWVAVMEPGNGDVGSGKRNTKKNDPGLVQGWHSLKPCRTIARLCSFGERGALIGTTIVGLTLEDGGGWVSPVTLAG